LTLIVASQPPCLTRPGKLETMMPVTFPLGEHLVSEADGMLVCQKCGRSTQITEADKFADTECETKTSQETVLTPKIVQTQPQQKNERQQCATCRLGEGKNEAPMLDPMTNQINKKLLCDNCFKDYLKILRFSGPRFGRVKVRAPSQRSLVQLRREQQHTLHADKRGVALSRMRRVLRKPIRRCHTLRSETHRDC
jgi:protein-arginine kinase activator protein McsA